MSDIAARNCERLASHAHLWEFVTEMARAFQIRSGLVADGIIGPLTEAELLEAIHPPAPAPATGWEPWDGPEDRQPRNRRELYAMLGNPGASGKMDPRWYREHIVECHPKHGNQLPGVPSGTYVHVHRIVEPYLREALRRARISCPDYEITRMGSHNHRHIRHDVSRPLSVHAFGAAVDINPHQNQGKTFARGTAPEAWTPEWFAIWPHSVPEAFVQAMASCGFAWGSDWNEDGDTSDHTFVDPMHFEWVARDGQNRLV